LLLAIENFHLFEKVSQDLFIDILTLIGISKKYLNNWTSKLKNKMLETILIDVNRFKQEFIDESSTIIDEILKENLLLGKEEALVAKDRSP